MSPCWAQGDCTWSLPRSARSSMHGLWLSWRYLPDPVGSTLQQTGQGPDTALSIRSDYYYNSLILSPWPSTTGVLVFPLTPHAWLLVLPLTLPWLLVLRLAFPWLLVFPLTLSWLLVLRLALPWLLGFPLSNSLVATGAPSRSPMTTGAPSHSHMPTDAPSHSHVNFKA